MPENVTVDPAGLILLSDGNTSGLEDVQDLLAGLGDQDFLPPPLPPTVHLTLIISYSIIMLAATVGNLLVLWVIAANAALHTVTNTYLASLAVSDLLIALVNMPLQLVQHVQSEWTLGPIPCKLTSYVQGITIINSILTLAGMAVDRYYAVCHPLRARSLHTLQRTAAVVMSFWVTSCILVSPQLAIQRVEPIIHRLPEPPYMRMAQICTEYFPDKQLYIAYTMAVYLVLYVIPVTILLVAYDKIAHMLHVRRPIGDTLENPRCQQKRAKETRQILCMLSVVVILFALSWSPFFTCQVYLLFQDSARPFQVLKAVLQLFGYSNCCVNPVIYCFLNENFRLHVLKTFPCVRHRARHNLDRHPTRTSQTPLSVTQNTLI